MRTEYNELTKQHCLKIFEKIRGGHYDIHKFQKDIEDKYPDGYKSAGGGKQHIWTRTLNKYTQDLYRVAKCMNNEKISDDETVTELEFDT